MKKSHSPSLKFLHFLHAPLLGFPYDLFQNQSPPQPIFWKFHLRLSQFTNLHKKKFPLIFCTNRFACLKIPWQSYKDLCKEMNKTFYQYLKYIINKVFRQYSHLQGYIKASLIQTFAYNTFDILLKLPYLFVMIHDSISLIKSVQRSFKKIH